MYEQNLNVEDFLREARKHAVGQNENNPVPPTPFEDDEMYSVLQQLYQDVEKVFQKKPPAPPLIGTLPTGAVNALTIRVPRSDETIIVFEDQLFTFALLFCKVASLLLVVEPSEGGAAHIREEPLSATDASEAGKRLSDLLRAYLLGGAPWRVQPYVLPPLLQMVVAPQLLHSFELFVMAHEFTHAVAGHLHGSESRVLRFGSQEVNVVQRNWEKELEADANGMVAVLADRGVGLRTTWAGGELFLVAVEIIENSLSVVMGRKEAPAGSITHPPAHLRRQATRERVYDFFREIGREDLIAGDRLALALSQTMLDLWKAHAFPWLEQTPVSALHARWRSG